MAIDQEYASIVAGMAQSERTREQAAEHLPGHIQPGSGVKFSLQEWQCNGIPYLQVSCEHCRTTIRTAQLDFTWKHCGRVDVVPEELNEKLKRIQIKLGIRKADSFVSQLLGKAEPALAVLKNF